MCEDSSADSLNVSGLRNLNLICVTERHLAYGFEHIGWNQSVPVLV